MDSINIDDIIRTALKEDMPAGDITTESIIPPGSVSRAQLVAKQTGIVAGVQVAARVFKLLDGDVEFSAVRGDGSRVLEGDIIAELSGNTVNLLKGERTALNFLQHLSGIATATHNLCIKVEGTNAVIADTRKTTPGLRYLEKYAVRTGGGRNHRYSLSDAVMIKDNHITACGGIRKAVEAARKAAPHTASIEVEASDLEQVRQALEAGADIIMLDNMSIEDMKQAAGISAGKAMLEASGNISEDNVRQVALTGVDIISSGSITHSAGALDISMKFR